MKNLTGYPKPVRCEKSGYIIEENPKTKYPELIANFASPLTNLLRFGYWDLLN